jgi:hypothetical protein
MYDQHVRGSDQVCTTSNGSSRRAVRRAGAVPPQARMHARMRACAIAIPSQHRHAHARGRLRACTRTCTPARTCTCAHRPTTRTPDVVPLQYLRGIHRPAQVGEGAAVPLDRPCASNGCCCRLGAAQLGIGKEGGKGGVEGVEVGGLQKALKEEAGGTQVVVQLPGLEPAHAQKGEMRASGCRREGEVVGCGAVI